MHLEASALVSVCSVIQIIDRMQIVSPSRVRIKRLFYLIFSIGNFFPFRRNHVTIKKKKYARIHKKAQNVTICSLHLHLVNEMLYPVGLFYILAARYFAD